MRLIVTTDADTILTEAAANGVRQDIDAWRDGRTSALVLNVGLHAAIELSDGTWARICHDHADPYEPDLAEAVPA